MPLLTAIALILLPWAVILLALGCLNAAIALDVVVSAMAVGGLVQSLIDKPERPL